MSADHLAQGVEDETELQRALKGPEFTFTAEVVIPDSPRVGDLVSRARELGNKLHAINVTDGSGANCHISSLAASAILLREGFEPVMQMSCRDRNRIGLQADALGAAALGLRNILAISGDGVGVGDHPGAKPVFDLDSMTLLQTLRLMSSRGQFLSGRSLASRPHYFCGAAINPFAPPHAYRSLRLRKKIEAGASFVQSQYCFDTERLRTYMAKARSFGCDERCGILIGVGPLTSARAARWMCANVPGVYIPDRIIRRLSASSDEREEGIKICVELMQEISQIPGVSGFHLMAFRQAHRVEELIERSGLWGQRRARLREA